MNVKEYLEKRNTWTFKENGDWEWVVSKKGHRYRRYYGDESRMYEPSLLHDEKNVKKGCYGDCHELTQKYLQDHDGEAYTNRSHTFAVQKDDNTGEDIAHDELLGLHLPIDEYLDKVPGVFEHITPEQLDEFVKIAKRFKDESK